MRLKARIEEWHTRFRAKYLALINPVREQHAAMASELAAVRAELAALKTERAAAAAAPEAAPQGRGGDGPPAADAARLSPAVSVRELEFAIDQFFVIGSPLGLFLALRRCAKGRLSSHPKPTLNPGYYLALPSTLRGIPDWALEKFLSVPSSDARQRSFPPTNRRGLKK